MQVLKAILEVTGGVVPGIRVDEHSRRWSYNSDDYEADMHTPGDQPTIFSRYLEEAHDYAKGLSNPQYLNWVNVNWVWL